MYEIINLQIHAGLWMKQVSRNIVLEPDCSRKTTQSEVCTGLANKTRLTCWG